MKKEHHVRLQCSFCGKAQRDVRKLIAGPTVYICDECIATCEEILDETTLDVAGASLSKLAVVVRGVADGLRWSHAPDGAAQRARALASGLEAAAAAEEA